MAHTLDLYWDFSSPYAYLGSTQADALAARTGATLRWRPMLLGGLFRAIGQADAPILTFSQAKQRHVMKDLERWAEYLEVPYKFPTRFPMVTIKPLRVYLALPEERKAGFRERTFRAYWAEDRDISDDGELRALIGEGADEILARTADPAIKEELKVATEKAAAAGVFGAPTWVVDETELFWGQDRIPLVERALRK
jgi:2-hydroxychromene-2-carboxylate isomerase